MSVSKACVSFRSLPPRRSMAISIRCDQWDWMGRSNHLRGAPDVLDTSGVLCAPEVRALRGIDAYN